MRRPRLFVPGDDVAARLAGQAGIMTIFSRWWSRPLSRSRAITSLLLMIAAIGLSVWAALGHIYDDRLGTGLAWAVAALLTIDAIRIVAGLSADRYPR
jgi:hypothetical protein